MARITNADRELLAEAYGADGWDNLALSAETIEPDWKAPMTSALRALAKQRLKHTEELAKERAVCGALIDALERINARASALSIATIDARIQLTDLIVSDARAALKSAGKDA